MSKQFSKNFYSKDDFPILRTELDKLELCSIEVTSFNAIDDVKSFSTVIVKYVKHFNKQNVEVLDIFQCEYRVARWLNDVYMKLRKDYFNTYVKAVVTHEFIDLPF